MIDKFEGEYFFLSNFYECPINYHGLTYRNSEAAFHAQKNVSRAREFCDLSPSEAKRLGRRVELREDWEEVKLRIMYSIVKTKFTQHRNLKKKLLSTGNQELVEGNWWNDCYWGVCKGIGQNNLGKILMKVRDELNHDTI